MGDASARDEDGGGMTFEQAHEPVAIPAPKPRKAEPGTAVRTDRAPTVQDLLEPQRPSLAGASHDDVVGSITALVESIYTGVLFERLETIGPELAEQRTPPDSDWGVRLIAWIAETIATGAIGAIGGLAAKRVGDRYGKIAGDATKDAAKSTGKTAGALANAWVASKRPRQAAQPGERAQPRYARSGTMLDEFLTATRLQLLAKKHDAITALQLVRNAAQRAPTADLVALDAELAGLANGPDLLDWFSFKVTAEWLNFCARMSLGPTPDDRSTDLPGANTFGGILEAGSGAVAWQRGHEGFVELTISTPARIDGTKGLRMRAHLHGGPRAAKMLAGANAQLDANGAPYSAATVPVYRRIRLQTGPTKLDQSVAFVITPDGEIEADYGNTVLAAIGRGEPVTLETARGAHTPPMNEQRRKDPNEWLARGERAAQAIAGARAVQAWLATQTLEGLK